MSEQPEEQLNEQQTGEPAAAPEFPWAKPTVQRVVQTEPLAYHRLWRGIPKYGWWRPLLAVILATIFYGVFSVVIGFLSGIAIAVQMSASQASLDLTELAAELLPDTQKPLTIVLACLSIIVMIPSALLGMLCVGIRPLGRIWSVTGRFRFAIFGRGLLLAGVAIVLPSVGLELLNAALGGGQHAFNDPSFSVGAALISAVLVLLFVPFQCLAEEVVFRGMLMQMIGSWIRQPWLVILLPSLLFAAAHIYDLWGLLAVFIIGITAGYLAWRSGGLEYAVSLHVANNLMAFWLMCTGWLPYTGQVAETGGNFLSVVIQLVLSALFVALCEWDMRKRPVQRFRVDSVLREVPADA